MLNRPNTAPSNNLSRVTNDNFTSISKPVSVVKKLPKNWFETVRDMKTVKVNGSVDRYKDEMGRYKHSVSSRKQEQNTKKLPKNWIETAVTNVAQNRPEMKLNVGSKKQTEANSSSKLNPGKIKLPNNWFNDIPETGHEKKAVTVAPVKLAKGWDLAASALVKDSLSRKDCTSIHISKGPRRKLGRRSLSSKNVNNVTKLPKNWMMTALARMPRTTQDNEPIIKSRKESKRHGHHGKVSKISPPIVKLPKDWVKTALPGEMKGKVKTLITRPEQLGEDWQVRNPHSWKKKSDKDLTSSQPTVKLPKDWMNEALEAKNYEDRKLRDQMKSVLNREKETEVQTNSKALIKLPKDWKKSVLETANRTHDEPLSNGKDVLQSIMKYKTYFDVQREKKTSVKGTSKSNGFSGSPVKLPKNWMTSVVNKTEDYDLIGVKDNATHPVKLSKNWMEGIHDKSMSGHPSKNKVVSPCPVKLPKNWMTDVVNKTKDDDLIGVKDDATHPSNYQKIGWKKYTIKV